MTEEQYKSFNNFQYLTPEEKQHEKDLNSKNNYGLSLNQLLTLTRKHRKARAIADFCTMAQIEYRLTDINFHAECGLLYKGNYDEVIKIIEEKYNL